MTIKRTARPRPGSQPGPVRSFEPKSDYGTCEHADCDRRARATCETCANDYCLAHAPHATHHGAPRAR